MAQRLLAAHATHRVAGLVLGVDAAKRADYADAAEKFKRSAVSLVGEVTSTLAGAWTRYAQGDVDGALGELDGMKQADWAQYYLRFHKALISDLAGRHQEAGRLYERAFRSEQRLVRLTLAYARHAAARGDRKLARSIIADHTRRTTGTVHPYIIALSESINDDGRTRSLPVGWTNVAPVDPFVTVAAGRAPFRLEDLLALTALLRDIRRPTRERPQGGGAGVK
jgi:hypothetical protein